MRRLLFILSFITLLSASAYAQIVPVDHEAKINADSVRRAFDSGPYFGLYKDNYFIFGPAVGQKVTRENTNVKFQISIAQKLTRSTLPWNTYLYLYYTQKVFWNILQNSMPMTDLNFNPGIGLCKPLFTRGRFMGKLTLQVEHESNGRDSIWSRSWNKVSLGANIIIDNNLMVHGKVWIPIVDGVNNKDILKYSGIYQIGTSILSNDRRWSGSVVLVKRKDWNPFNYNTILELAFRLSRNQNQFLFLQYYNGFGEGLLEYNKFHSQLRVGIVIKPELFSDF
ncbi:MAG: phospholipase A [Muribaculaceae bacterium]|nr:phospholipase A [Muribaculaceae bacterium]MDE7387328.1 phospholipase A [Muribaculaceae bacterium]